MNDIQVKRLNSQEIAALGITSWPIWEKEASSFDWYYDSKEDCYFLQGEVEVETGEGRVADFTQAERDLAAAYIYEPDREQILDEIIPRFTALQVYQAVMESLASEHAARMVAMKNATDSAIALADALQLEYNKARQQTITNEMLDIAGGVEALANA